MLPYACSYILLAQFTSLCHAWLLGTFLCLCTCLHYIPHIIDSWKQAWMAWGILWGARSKKCYSMQTFVILTFRGVYLPGNCVHSIRRWLFCISPFIIMITRKCVYRPLLGIQPYNFISVCGHQKSLAKSGTINRKRYLVCRRWDSLEGHAAICRISFSFEVRSEWDTSLCSGWHMKSIYCLSWLYNVYMAIEPYHILCQEYMYSWLCIS